MHPPEVEEQVYWWERSDTIQRDSGEWVALGLVLTVVLMVHSVAYTGCASTGLPTMPVDLDARMAFLVETRQAVRASARLRTGIACAAGARSPWPS